MKRISGFLLALVMLLNLSACGMPFAVSDLLDGIPGIGDRQDAAPDGDTPESPEPTADVLAEIRAARAEITWDLTGGVLTVKGDGAMPDYAMRTADNDLGMTSDAPWFERRLEVTSLVIGEGITYVGEWAFPGFENMTSVSFPSTLRAFGMGSMGGSSVEEIVIPDSVEFLGAGMFADSGRLSRVTVGSSVREIPYAAFSYCEALQEAVLPDGLTYIGEEGFYECFLLQRIDLPSALTGIGSSAFAGCENLTALQIPASVTELGEYSLFNTGLTEVTIPEGIAVLHSGTFSGCDNLTTVHLPLSLKTVDISAFGECGALTNVTYAGTAADWAAVTVDSRHNDAFLDAVKRGLVYGAEEPVSLIFDETVPDPYGGVISFRIPQVNLDSVDARNVNAELAGKWLAEAQEAAPVFAAGGEAEQGEIICSYRIANDVLSLVVKSEKFFYYYEEYAVYNFSLADGRLIGAQELAAAFGMTPEEYNDRLYAAVEEVIERDYPDLEEELRGATLSQENLAAAYTFIGNSAEGLQAVVAIHVPAGSGIHLVTVSL